jgi:hypothetical protein
MPRWPYLSPDGQQKFVWLDDRSARAVALLVAATRRPDTTRARAEELTDSITVWPSSGLLAAHALSLSAVEIATNVISLGVRGTSDCMDVDLICNLAAEMRPLAAALQAAHLELFDTVGLGDRLPAPGGDCGSVHAATRTVLADVRSRAEPILSTLDFLGDEPPAVLAERARTKGDDLLETLHDQLTSQYHASLVKQWDGWATVHRKLVAEVAGAARAGLIPAEGGGRVDQTRFDAAIDRVLRELDEAQRQYLFSRWRSIASVARYIRVVEGMLPILRLHKPEIDGLAKLSSEVLGHTADPKNDGTALLELLDVLRELKSLTVREEHLRATDRVPELDADFAGRVRALVQDTLPRLLREATMEVDRLSLLPPQRLAPPSVTTAAQSGGPKEPEQPSPGTRSPPTSGQSTREPTGGRAMTTVDKALCRLLFQDIASGSPRNVLRMSTKELCEAIRGSARRAPQSGALRPQRTPHFRAFQAFFARNPKGRPMDLIRQLPDRSLRDDLEQYHDERPEGGSDK